MFCPPSPTSSMQRRACAAGSSRRRCSSRKPSTRRVGARVLFKAECLQHTGSFKIRGALNRLLQLSADERAAGVVAFSSGNHAQAVALAARWLDVPRDDRDAGRCAEGQARAHARARRRGRALRPRARGPRSDRGRASPSGAARRSCRRSIIRTSSRGRARSRSSSRAPRASGTSRIDAFYAPCSGGGLVAGCALALKAEWPSCAVYAVEPRGFEDHAASLAAGERRTVAPGGTTLCDGLRAPMPGAITFAINRRELAGARRRRRRADSRGHGRRGAASEGRRRAVGRRGARGGARASRGRAERASPSCSRAATSTPSCSPTCCAPTARMTSPRAARNST